jgi:hypothetical protein
MELELEKEKLLEYLKKDLQEKMAERTDKKLQELDYICVRSYVIS